MFAHGGSKVIGHQLMQVIVHHPALFSMWGVFNGTITGTTLADGSGNGDTLKAVLVSGLALILSASIPAWIATLNRNRQHVGVEVESAAVKALIKSNTVLSEEYRLAIVRIDQLEALCFDNGINPHTGLRTGHTS